MVDPDDVEEAGNVYNFELTGSACNVKIDNTDLSAIFNGYPGDPLN